MCDNSKLEIRAIIEELKKTEEEPVKRKELNVLFRDYVLLRYNELSYIINQIHDLRHEFYESIRELLERIDRIERKIAEHEKREIVEVEFRRIPKDEAKKLIKEYIKNNPGCFTSEIIEALHLDPKLVIEILHELEEKGEVLSREPE